MGKKVKVKNKPKKKLPSAFEKKYEVAVYQDNIEPSVNESICDDNKYGGDLVLTTRQIKKKHRLKFRWSWLYLIPFALFVYLFVKDSFDIFYLLCSLGMLIKWVDGVLVDGEHTILLAPIKVEKHTIEKEKVEPFMVKSPNELIDCARSLEDKNEKE